LSDTVEYFSIAWPAPLVVVVAVVVEEKKKRSGRSLPSGEDSGAVNKNRPRLRRPFDPTTPRLMLPLVAAGVQAK